MSYVDHAPIPTSGLTRRPRNVYSAPRARNNNAAGKQKPKELTIEDRAFKMGQLFNDELENGTHTLTRNSLAVQWLTDLYRHVAEIDTPYISRELGARLDQFETRRAMLREMEYAEMVLLLRRLKVILDKHDKVVVKFSHHFSKLPLPQGNEETKAMASVLIVHFSLRYYAQLRAILELCEEGEWGVEQSDIDKWDRATNDYIKHLVVLYNALRPDTPCFLENRKGLIYPVQND